MQWADPLLQRAWPKGRREKESGVTLELSGVYGKAAAATISVLYPGNRGRNYSKQKRWECSHLANLIVILLKYNLSPWLA